MIYRVADVTFSMQSAAGVLLTHLSQYGAAVQLGREETLAAVASALAGPAEVSDGHSR